MSWRTLGEIVVLRTALQQQEQQTELLGRIAAWQEADFAENHPEIYQQMLDSQRRQRRRTAVLFVVLAAITFVPLIVLLS